MTPWVDPDTHGWVHHPRDDADWNQLLADYGATTHGPLANVFRAARANRCRTVIVENRYVDPDYRSEYSAFWSHRFLDRPAFARRLHFFRRRITDEEVHRLPANHAYLGYCTLRPLCPGLVGRTMIAPPDRLAAKATLTLATDKVSLWGNELMVRAAPFCEQDVEYLRCAHAAAWMCHYYAACEGLVGRRLTAELVDRPRRRRTPRGLRRDGAAMDATRRSPGRAPPFRRSALRSRRTRGMGRGPLDGASPLRSSGSLAQVICAAGAARPTETRRSC